jgi:hypothetical protein
MKSKNVKEYIALKAKSGYLDEVAENIAIKAVEMAEEEIVINAIEVVKKMCLHRERNDNIEGVFRCGGDRADNPYCNGTESDGKECYVVRTFKYLLGYLHEKKYCISDTLQNLIDWDNIMKMEREAGGHDEQMQGLFRGAVVIGHSHDNDLRGLVATCVQLQDGRFVIYNDFFGSCSGCDAWCYASDEEVRALCINLANNALIFKCLDDVMDFLSMAEGNYLVWYNWADCAGSLLKELHPEWAL